MYRSKKETESADLTISDKLQTLKGIRSLCEDEKRLPSDEEDKKCRSILDEIKVLEANKKAFWESEYAKQEEEPYRTPVGQNPFAEDRPATGPATGKDYRSMFGQENSLSMGGFNSSGEFLDILASGRYDERLQQRATQVEGTPSLGGFSVPEQMTAQWLDDSLPNEIVRPLCQVWPMSSETRKIPSWDNSDQSSGELFGGFKMEFLAEAATGTKQTGKMRLIQLEANKGAIFCDISSELSQDGLGFEAQLNSALKKSISHGIDRNCLIGSGAGQPQGVFNSSALITISKESGQAADTIVYENLAKMFARQLNKDRAVWLFNDDAIPSLLQISIAIGTGGSHVPILNEANGKFTIFGRPCFFSSIMPTVGDAHDCGFIDFGAYALGMRKEMSIDKSNAPGWTEDLISYRIIIRFDGQGVLSSEITPENGETLSPFVSLAERA